MDHDLDLSPGTPSEVSFSSGAMCDSECSNSAPCFPIPVLAGDVRLTGQCMPFTRSGGVCGTGSSSLLVGDSPIWREQINAITSFLDSSMVSLCVEWSYCSLWLLLIVFSTDIWQLRGACAAAEGPSPAGLAGGGPARPWGKAVPTL